MDGTLGAAASPSCGAESRRPPGAACRTPGSSPQRPSSEYDDYYYSRHNRYRPLPAYRVTFDDAESTWFYVDWTTGAVVLRYTTAARVQRWLYNGLHSLDFSFLTAPRRRCGTAS